MLVEQMCCVVCISGMIFSDYLVLFFFFFKQKTAYEMRISDWSSDVCSSDLQCADRVREIPPQRRIVRLPAGGAGDDQPRRDPDRATLHPLGAGGAGRPEIGRASCRERVCQYV